MSIRAQMESLLEDLLLTEEKYYSVKIPWSKNPTKWHPTSKTGPFSVLTRGAFKSEAQAKAWAEKHLRGQPYEVVKVSY